MVGSRRYLLESNDFYALRDLTDLSKGAFAGKYAVAFCGNISAEFIPLFFRFLLLHRCFGMSGIKLQCISLA